MGNPIAEDILMHYGMKFRSGRYPWGSGDSPYQHSGDFLSRVEELKKEGHNEKDIAKEVKVGSTTELRLYKQVASHERVRLLADKARSLRDDGKSYQEIADIMGYTSESSVRAILNPNTLTNKNKAIATADILKKEIEKKGMLDVGADVERELGCSKLKLQEALLLLEADGYVVHPIGMKQAENKNQLITMPVLCKPGTEYKYVCDNIGDVKSVGDYHSTDGGDTYNKIEYPASIDSKRVAIRYGDEGGLNKDGVIEIRRGVPDLDLGPSHYAQVRILVDGTHFLKGMAVYSDDVPKGSDIIFNTNKKSGTPKMKVLKEIEPDPDNPFGAAIKANGQSKYIDKDGKKKLSAINKLKEEGDWNNMQKNLSSQFLAKQPMKLIKKQLGLTYDDYISEYKDIVALDNPTIKKKLLMDFANNCDAATVHLKAAALPRQSTQVILPNNGIKENEIYALNYNNGEKVALVRYPHAGTFEIPVLTVNNRNKSAINVFGKDLKDAVGINAKVAERLSGADFDGDHVVVIPLSSKINIKTSPALKGLEGFDPKTKYSTDGKTGIRLMRKKEIQKEMGGISNLITDMTLRGATPEEMVRAVKHSMVVIDAYKHKLDYKQSEKDNGISALQKKYQVRIDSDGNIKYGGASTLFSRRKQDTRIPERKGSGKIDPETGKVIYKESGRTYKELVKDIDPETKLPKINPKTGKYIYKETGKILPAQTKLPLMSTLDDARDISSGTPEENEYAKYVNKMKALANTARKEYLSTGNLKYSKEANSLYSKEVKSLNDKIDISARNSPKERRANAIALSSIKAKMIANPGMDKKELQKVSHIEKKKARELVGAGGKESRIHITDKEWEAIQAGAISNERLKLILRYSDDDEIRKRATPRSSTTLTPAKVSKINAMKAMGYTYSEIAQSVKLSTSTVQKQLEKDGSLSTDKESADTK